MRLLFVSNDLTHHLVPFFTSLTAYYGTNNCVFAVRAPLGSRESMGFPIYNEPWVFKVYENNRQEYERLWTSADIIICRCWDETKLMHNALIEGKVVFYASERWFKPPVGALRLILPHYYRRYQIYKRLSQYSNFYYLAMGYYAFCDFEKMGLCKGRIYSFGYFTPRYENNIPKSNKQLTTIMWAGRMLKWKRVKDIISVFKRIENKYDVRLLLIGKGPENENIKRQIKKERIKNVHLMTFVQNEKLKEMMCEADIYILPSSGYEGWGAVINEAMQCKCVVVASKEAGAARSMIENGVTGFTYPSGQLSTLETVLVSLLENKQKLMEIKENGYNLINSIWSAEEAARRFMLIAERIRCGATGVDIFKSGPMQLLY